MSPSDNEVRATRSGLPYGQRRTAAPSVTSDSGNESDGGHEEPNEENVEPSHAVGSGAAQAEEATETKQMLNAIMAMMRNQGEELA